MTRRDVAAVEIKSAVCYTPVNNVLLNSKAGAVGIVDNAIKHLEKLRGQIDSRLGKGRADEILEGIGELTGDETPAQIGEWAAKVTEKLEAAIPREELIPIREECACIKANKYSAYNKKYFPEIREIYPENDEEYMRAVAAFLSGRGRCGKVVEYVDGKIISHFGFGDACVCYVIKGGWGRPPSDTWCRCCQGTVKSILQFVFPDKKCSMDIIETFATGGTDCVFSASFSDN